MHNKYFEILPSNTLGYWTIGIHVSVFLLILSLPISFPFKLCFLFLVGLSYFFSRNKKNIIKSFEHDKNENWKLYTVQGEQYFAKLLKKNYVSDFLLILRFESTQAIVLFRNQLSPQSWRHLQMIIRN